jgi:hypothetical protein
MPTPIPSPPGMGRSLIDHDPRNRDYPIRALLETKPPRRNRTWRRSGAYDQGQTSSCVGQTFKGVLNTRPESSLTAWVRRSRYDAIDFYKGAQQYDEWDGAEPTYQGTSARGACRYLQNKGLIREYRWCFGLDDVLDTLSHHGPVAIGVHWYAGMMRTDDHGYVHPTGRMVGGHEVELHGIDVREKYVVGTNSWGKGWGKGGRFKLTWIDLDRLLHEQGDAVTLT